MANINMTQEQLDNVVTAINNRAKTSVVETKTSAMTKAQFNALAEERKANRAGSGFDEWGVYNATGSATTFFGSGTSVRGFQNMIVSSMTGGSWDGTFFSCFGKNSSSIISGVTHKHEEASAIRIPTAPNIYPHDTVLTTEQINSGVIKHADSSNSGLIVNGKFNVDTSGWSGGSGATLSTESGSLKVQGGVTNYPFAYQVIPTVIGKKYKIEGYSTSGVNTAFSAYSANPLSGGTQLGIIVNTTPTNSYSTVEFTATTTSTWIICSIESTVDNSSATFDNIAVYPADSISRSDLVFLESWHEDVSEKNIVYPLGNTQYLGGNTDGLTGIANGSFTGFETYSLFGNWQTSSALIGKGYVWSSLTEAQRKAFIANTDNNCYLDGDKTIQVRYRVRVVQGLGDNWNYPLNSQSWVGYSNVVNTWMKAKGKQVATGEYLTSNTAEGGFVGGVTTTKDVLLLLGDYGVYGASNNGSLSTQCGYEGKCYALPIDLVHRRNQGMYHPVYNPNGTKKAVDGNFWYNTTETFTSISDCFNPSKLLATSGYIGSVSGRPDGLFYDQVHDGDITDLRNSSKKVEDYNRLISREFNKLVAGSARGKEGESDIVIIRTFTKTSTFGQDNNRFYFGISSAIYLQQSFLPKENNSYYLLGNNGSVYSVNQVINQSATGTLYIPLGTTQVYIPIDGKNTAASMNTLFPDGTTITVIVVKRTTRTKSNTLLHCDIIGNPSNYPTAWKQSGVFGTPLIVAEDGTSLLPDGARDTFKLSRKANATPLLCLRSTDNGATWTSFTPTFSATTNAITLTDEPANNLVMVYYQTKTLMAVPTVNSEVLEIGDVYTSNSPYSSIGNSLINTLIGKVPVGTVAPVSLFNGKSIGYKFFNSPIEKLDVVTEYKPSHQNIALLGTTTSPTAKVLPYLTRANGKAYLNLVFKEMKHNGTSWGDDNKFNIVDNVSTTTDNNAQTVLIGQKTVELPYFVDAGE